MAKTIYLLIYLFLLFPKKVKKRIIKLLKEGKVGYYHHKC